jgi:CheY-specific phosphatase CheX
MRIELSASSLPQVAVSVTVGLRDDLRGSISFSFPKRRRDVHSVVATNAPADVRTLDG